jgi:hypothetical protein
VEDFLEIMEGKFVSLGGELPLAALPGPLG